MRCMRRGRPHARSIGSCRSQGLCSGIQEIKLLPGGMPDELLRGVGGRVLDAPLSRPDRAAARPPGYLGGVDAVRSGWLSAPAPGIASRCQCEGPATPPCWAPKRGDGGGRPPASLGDRGERGCGEMRCRPAMLQLCRRPS